MLLRNLFRTIQTSWRWVAIATLLGLMFSLFVSIQAVPLYRSTASFLIYPNASLVSSRDVVTSLNTLGTESVSKTYLEIFNSDRVFKDTVEKLGFDKAILEDYVVLAVVTTGSNIELSVSGPNPQMAALLANNIGQNGINYIKSIYQVFDIAFLDQASEPGVSYAPNTLRDGLLSALAGFLLGIAFVLARESSRAPFEMIRRRALSDDLSGAFMLRHFRTMFEQEINRNPAEPLAFALIQLEGLEDVLDVLPERALSNLLHQVTRILRNQLRGSDVVGQWNKTTFAVLMPSTPSAGAIRSLERIRTALNTPILLELTGEKVNLAPCTGWTSRVDGETTAMLEENAGKALDAARTAAGKIAEVTQAK